MLNPGQKCEDMRKVQGTVAGSNLGSADADSPEQHDPSCGSFLITVLGWAISRNCKGGRSGGRTRSLSGVFHLYTDLLRNRQLDDRERRLRQDRESTVKLSSASHLGTSPKIFAPWISPWTFAASTVGSCRMGELSNLHNVALICAFLAASVLLCSTVIVEDVYFCKIVFCY